MFTGGAHLVSSAQLLIQPAADTFQGYCRGNELSCKGNQARAGGLQSAATQRIKTEKLMVLVYVKIDNLEWVAICKDL